MSLNECKMSNVSRSWLLLF